MKYCTYFSAIRDNNPEVLTARILKEHPLWVLLPTLPFLQHRTEQLIISWFQRENEHSLQLLQLLKKEVSRWINQFLPSSEAQETSHKTLEKYLAKLQEWTNNNTDLGLDKKIKANISFLSCELITNYLQTQSIPAQIASFHPLIHLTEKRTIDLEETQQSLQHSIRTTTTPKLLISPLSICENATQEIDFLNEKYHEYYVGTLNRILEKETYGHKKRLSIPDSQSFFVNLKSNTMKNTLQRYVLFRSSQIMKAKNALS